MEDKEDLYRLGKALQAFWKDYGNGISVNAKHTYVSVEPKFIIGNRVNQEVAKRLISVYLSQITSDKVVSEEVVITNNGIKLFDHGELVMEIMNQRLVDSINNEVTSQLGKELSQIEKKSGGTYIEGKETPSYTFGEIKQALTEFLFDMEKQDSKNLLKDAILLLVNDQS